MQKKTTMTDIAKALGVSQTLVSFVLSGKNDMGISPDTKKKVLQTAEKMGYCSKAASKMLKLGRSGYVALVFESVPNASALNLIGYINKGLTEYGYSLIVPGCPEDGIDFDECKALFDDSKTDGFIVIGNEKKLSEMLGNNTPIVGTTDYDTEALTSCARLLCEKILCGEVNEKSSEKRRTTAKQKTKKPRKASPAVKRSEPPAEKKEEAPVRRSNDSIWLL